MSEPLQRKCYWCPLREFPLREISDCQYSQCDDYRWACSKTKNRQYCGYSDCKALYGIFKENEEE